MASVVILDEDRELADALGRMLSGRGFDVRIAHGSGDALASIAARPPDILVAEVRAGGGDVRAFLEPALRIAPATAPIVLSSGAAGAELEQARALGAIAVLAKPFTPIDLENAIARAREFGNGYRASLHGLNLTDMLQMFHLAGRSVVLELGGNPRGQIEFDAGEVVHATFGERSGEDALRGILATSSGSIRTAPYEGGPRTIGKSFASLLLDVVHRFDEAARDPEDEGELNIDRVDRALDSITEDVSADLPPPPLEEGVLDEAVLEVPELAQDAPSLLPSRRPELGRWIDRPYDDICRAVLAEIPGASACALVDLRTQAVVGSDGDSPLDRVIERTVGLHTRSLFRGAAIPQLERWLLGASQGAEIDQVEEAHLVSARAHHLAKTLRGAKYAAVLVLPRSGDAGLAWSRLRALLPGLERHL